MLHQAGVAIATCPHPAARETHAIAVSSRQGAAMVLCATCFETMRATIQQWHAYSVKPSTVYRRLRMLEYSRADAIRFVVQLIADRAQVRLGLISRSQVDV